jgi:hypothetical protein
VQHLAAALDEFDRLSHNRRSEGSALLPSHICRSEPCCTLRCRCSSWLPRLWV